MGIDRSRQSGRKPLLLGSVALVVLGGTTAATAAGAPEEQVAVTLTDGNDTATIPAIDLMFDRLPDSYGLAPPILAIGVRALPGDDDVAVHGASTVIAQVREEREYSAPPEAADLVQQFAEGPHTRAGAVGLDGGPGDDRLVQRGALRVEADSGLQQRSFVELIPGVSLALDAAVTATATGLAGGSGADLARSEGILATAARADGQRIDLDIDFVAIGGLPQALVVRAIGEALSGGDGADTLEAAAGSRQTVVADAAARSRRVSLESMRLSAPASATVAEALATGISGGHGPDRLMAHGDLDVSAVARAREFDGSIIVKDLTLPDEAGVQPEAREGSRAVARALGLAGGAGDDILAHGGTMRLRADAERQLLSMTIGDGGIASAAIVVRDRPEMAREEPTAGAIASVIAMAGGGIAAEAGRDVLTNSAVIDGTALAAARTDTLFVALPLSEVLGNPWGPLSTVADAFGIGLLGGSTDSHAAATGLLGGADRDILTNEGAIQLVANGRSSLIAGSVVGLDAIDPGDGKSSEPFSLNFTFFNLATSTQAKAIGLSGMGGDDMLENRGGIALRADAEADTAAINLSLGQERKSLLIDAPAIFADSWADASATGIDGGSGRNRIAHSGDIAVEADARARQLTASLSTQLVDTGVAGSLAYVDSNIRADANATGIADPTGFQGIDAPGRIQALARANTQSVSANLGLGVERGSGAALAGSLVQADQRSHATARGIAVGAGGGMRFAGPVRVGSGAADAVAEAERLKVGVSAASATKGLALSATLTSSRTEAVADATAVTLASAARSVSVEGDLAATARATARNADGSVGLAVAEKGVAAGVVATRLDTRAAARAAALDLAISGPVVILGGLLAEAHGTAETAAIQANLAGGQQGVALGATLLDGRTSVTADATGLATGGFADTIDALGPVAARADATARSLDASLSIATESKGVAAGVALARTDTSADSRAVAVALGDGDDRFSASSAIGADARAHIRSISASVGLGLTGTGVGAGAAAVDSGVRGTARALGVDGGSGRDRIEVAAPVDVRARSDAATVGISLGLGLSPKGVSVGLAGLIGDTDAKAHAAGLAGGTGADLIVARGPVTVRSEAEGTRTDIALASAATLKGAAITGTMLLAETLAEARATGLGGDTADGETAGDGDDSVVAEGELRVEADAMARANSVSISGPLAVGFTASLLKAETEATARAQGLAGGGGDDLLWSRAPLSVDARSTARGFSLNLATVGAALGRTDTAARAHAFGLSGGTGGDLLLAEGPVRVAATADARSLAISITATGFSLGRQTTEADAFAVGLSGGAGDDLLDASGPVHVTAVATAPQRSINIGNFAGVLGDARVKAGAAATGIDAGVGDDRLVSTTAVTVESDAEVRALSVSFAKTGLVNAEVGSRAIAGATAVDMGFGNDSVDLAGPLRATARSRTTGINIAANVSGGGRADSSSHSEATAHGLAAGLGHLSGQVGAIHAESWARADDVTVAASLAGYSEADASIRSTAKSAAIRTAGTTDLESIGRLTALALATAESQGGNLGILNITLADLTAHGRAGATGFESRAESGDVLWRLGGPDSFTVNAESRATARTIPIGAFGLGFIDTGARSFADAALVHGTGAADHGILVAPSGTVRAVSKANLESILANIGGLANLDHRSEARAHAVGVRAAGGSDTIDLRSPTILIEADSSIESAMQRFAFGSLAYGRMDLRAEADAALARSGDGDDVVDNRGEATVRATAAARATGADIQGGGVILDNRGVGASALAVATGIDGGGGNDTLRNGRPLDVLASARSLDAPVSFQFIGVDLADAASSTEARATGIAGGDGNDLMWNSVLLKVRAESSGLGRNTSIAIAGALLGDANVTSTAHAIGMDGGTGRDILGNFGLLDVSASATGRASNLNVTGVGAVLRGGARNRTEASATGMAGGDGNNSLFSNNQIRVVSTAGGAASSSAIATLGAASADVSATVLARATGMVAGAGDDRIEQRSAPYLVQAGSFGQARSLTATGGGVTFRGRGESLSRAEAVGIDAGDGANLILLSGPTAVLAEAGLVGGTLNVTVAGVGRAELRTAAEASADGIRAGSGDDEVLVEAPLSTLAVANINSVGRSIAVFGSGSARTDTRAEAGGTGIALGDGRNRLDVWAPLALESRSFADVSASTFTLAGTAVSGGVALAHADQIGIRAGNGDDLLAVDAPLTVLSTADMRANGSSMAVFGAASTGGDFGASANATGVALGAGTDSLGLSQRARVEARATTASDLSSYAFAGVAGGKAALATTATALGIDGGFGAKVVGTTGLDVLATATTSLTGTHRVEFGATGGRSAILSAANASGVVARGTGGGFNLAAASTVRARADASFGFSDFVLAGVANGRNAATAASSALGIDPGLGANVVLLAPLLVEALPTVVGSGVARATIGGKATAASETVALGNAVGIRSASAMPQLRVASGGRLDVRVDPRAAGSNTAAAGAFFSDGCTYAQARVEASATGIALERGATLVELAGSVEARVMGYRPGVETGVARAFAESTGTAGIANSTQANATSSFTQRAVGLDIAGGPPTTVRINAGVVLQAEARGHLYTEAMALGSQSLFTGDSWARANGTNENALAVALHAGGILDLVNHGGIVAGALPSATMYSVGRNSGIKDIGANARANAISFLDLDGATAIGVHATGWGARIENHRAISAHAAPEATAFAKASRLQGIEPVNAAATASSYVNGTRAWGILSTTTFATTVLNTDLIVAVADPYALADSDPNAAGPLANATARATAEAINTRAFGIETGSGNDHIENKGTISVQSLPQAVARVSATPGKGGSKNNFPEYRAEVYVAGIVTGAGNDIVVNRGTIKTNIGTDSFRAGNNTTVLGRVAIDTGPGNDQLFLLGGSTEGDILLGPGDDLLQIQNAPAIRHGVVRGGSGRDMLRLFEGGADQVLNVAEFEDIEKFGIGTWRLTGYSGNQTMRAIAGTLAFTTSMSLGGTHQMTSRIWPDGTVGQIRFENSLLQTLRGTLTVETVPGVHVNGRTWDVLASPLGFANQLSGITLPPPTALVSFSGGFQGLGPFASPTRYRVRVSVAPMADLVRGSGGPVESFAAALDAATPVARGAVAQQITTLQGLDTSQSVVGMVRQLAPQLPQLGLGAGANALGQGLALVAARPGGGGFAPSPGLAMGMRSGGSAPGPDGATWAMAFTGSGALGGPAAARRSAGFATGWQVATTNDLGFGVAMVRQQTEHGRSDSSGSGLADSLLLIGHSALPVGPHLALAAQVAAGSSHFAGGRSIAAIDGGMPARMQLDQSLLAAGLGARWSPFGSNAPLRIEAGLDWQRVAASATREAASSGLALTLDEGRQVNADATLAVQWQHEGMLGRLPVQTDLRLASHHGLAPGAATVTARFADMPDHKFTLAGWRPDRHRIAFDVATRLWLGKAATISATGQVRTGEATATGRTRTDTGVALQLSISLP